MNSLRLVCCSVLVSTSLLSLVGCGEEFSAGGAGGASSASSSASSASGSGTTASAGGGATASSSASSSSGGGSCDVLDCSKSECDGVAHCAAPAPDGWNGPIGVIASDPGQLPADCPAGWTTQAKLIGGDLQGDPRSCNCTCGSLLGACTAKYTAGANTGCTTAATSDAVANTCKVLANVVSMSELTTALPQQLVGTCDASLHKQPAAPPSWSKEALACGLKSPATGCEGSDVCVPSSAQGFKLCIWMPGVVACPSDGYKNSVSGSPFGTGVTDTRDCDGQCTCAPPVEPDCSQGTLTVFENGTCAANDGATASAPVDLTTHCVHPASQAVGSVLYEPANPGSCTPDGAITTSGEVTLDMPVTICCE